MERALDEGYDVALLLELDWRSDGSMSFGLIADFWARR